jgi:ribonuclease-3
MNHQLPSKAVIESIVGTKIDPRKLTLYQRAFCHKSCLKEYPQIESSYETLEFIGDSVLGFIITRWLFDRYEARQEGFLTKARTKLVRHEMLSSIASKLGLQHHVLMDQKGLSHGWNNNPKILEDVLESLVGALYLDLGLVSAKTWILSLYENPYYVDLSVIECDDNWKDHAMRYCQTLKHELPEYRVVSHTDGNFTIDIYIDGKLGGRGIARSKKQAEQLAAKDFFVRYLATHKI